MRLQSFFSKRYFGFFILHFVIWFVVSTTLTSMYDIVRQPILLYASGGFTLVFWMLIAYLYFRHARNDWTARLVVGVTWLVFTQVITAALAEPVLGLKWTAVFNSYTYFGGILNLLMILLGAVLAPHVEGAVLLARSRAALRPSSDLLPRAQDSELPQ